MAIPQISPNTIFNRFTPSDGLLFGIEYTRLYANDRALPDQLTALDPQTYVTDTPNWSAPLEANLASSQRAFDSLVQSLVPTFLKNMAAWFADFWVIHTNPVDNTWTSICWSPQLGIFAVVGSTGSGNRFMTTRNGIGK
ncbi:hypothetical protein AB3N61_06685 [Leptospira sp. WS58.C1]|uniref:hypothetical protein n=1 Tax=Leptospira cinconiae TaxID=3235173 RepID=UPI00349EBD7E